MIRSGRRIALILGLVITAGCNRQDADALARIGQLVAARAKSLPEMKSPANGESKDKPQKSEPPG